MTYHIVMSVHLALLGIMWVNCDWSEDYNEQGGRDKVIAGGITIAVIIELYKSGVL